MGTVRVKGLKQLNRAFREYDKDVRKDLRDQIKKAAEPVRIDAARRFAPVHAATAAGFRIAVRTRGVAIEQRKRRTTGAHPEFGARQMREALIPAREAKTEQLIEGLEDFLDHVALRNGF